MWTVVKMFPGWHWCPILMYNWNRWGRKDRVQLQLDSILQKKHQHRDETALPKSCLSSVHLWSGVGNWTLTFRDLSLWLNYKPSVSRRFRQELSLDKREEKHCETWYSWFVVILALCVLFSSVYSYHLPDHHIDPSCSYRPCDWGSLEIPEEWLGCASNSVLLRLLKA